MSPQSNPALARDPRNQTKSKKPTQPAPAGNFHNPYNFIPAPARKQKNSELGDANPKGHGLYTANCWSGRIPVRLTTQTPLLIPDAATARKNGDHWTFDTRRVNGDPYLAPTSIKGMLRSAFEAVTNSRFGVFEKHDDRLAYRMPAESKPNVAPARVEEDEDGQLVLRIMKSHSKLRNRGYTAKLQRYKANKKHEKKRKLPLDKGESETALSYSDGTLPAHGDHVWVNYDAESYVKKKEGIRRWDDPPGNHRDWHEGWVCITGANIESKRSERVFLPANNDVCIEIDKTILDLWEELIRNYQEEHKKAIKSRKTEKKREPHDYLGSEPGETAWSRHVCISEEIQLRKGTLCYVESDGENNIIGIQPVTISRRLFDKAPIDLVNDSLKPPTSIAELSPAERVFGWVNQKGKGGYKGNLRIHAVNCHSDKDKAVEQFGDEGLPLAILGQPKPSQFRFYASDDEGDPISSHLEKRDGYSQGQQIRGRKVYPHHNSLPADHWKDPTDGRERNYRQSNDAPKVRSNQNRSIKNWVKPGTIFTFNIDITNLSTVELGALLWLLTLPAEHFHRLGGGKPLGFGSVRLELDPAKTLDLRTGEQWKKFYSSLLPIETPPADIHESIAAFKTAVKTDYGPTFEETDFIKAFLTMAKGFEDGLPTHYPRTQSQPEPKGEGFKWFVANEQVGKGGRLNLPLLTEDKGLPYKANQ